MTTLTRAAAKIACSLDSSCWEWTAGLDRDGYAKLWHDGETRRAARVIYELLVGPIPSDLVIDHLCRVRHCVNPQHLRLVTSGENVLAGVGHAAVNARKLVCLRGHPLEGSNGRRRWCRRCQAMHARTYRRRKKET